MVLCISKVLRVYTLFIRHASVTSALYGRGSPRRSRLPSTELPEDFPKPSAENLHQSERPFDMNKFADAVRGRLDTEVEEDFFKKQKPNWMMKKEKDDETGSESKKRIYAFSKDDNDSTEFGDLSSKKKEKKSARKYLNQDDWLEDQAAKDRKDIMAEAAASSKKIRKPKFRQRDEEIDEEPEKPVPKAKFSSPRSKSSSSAADDSKTAKRRTRFDEEATEFQRRNALFSNFQKDEGQTLDSEDSLFGSSNTISKSSKRGKGFSKHSSKESFDEFKEDHGRKARSRASFTGTHVVLNEGDHFFKKSIMEARSRVDRIRTRKILLEGTRLIEDALQCGISVNTIFFSLPDLMQQIASSSNLDYTEVFKVSKKDMQTWSSLTTPPGILAVAEVPDMEMFREKEYLPLTVVTDNIRDPGNLGGIIRSLAGAGCSRVLVTKNCVDVWDQKVLRAGMGGHFRMPIYWNVLPSNIDNYWEGEEDNKRIFLADNLEERHPSIPYIDESKCVTLRERKFERTNLDAVPYHEVDFSHGHIVLLVGGETSGVRPELYTLTELYGGNKVTIPMEQNLESLNATAAISVLAFEVKRQKMLTDDKNTEYFQADDEEFESDDELNPEKDEEPTNRKRSV